MIELVFVRSFLSLGLSFLANANGRGSTYETSGDGDGTQPPLFGRRENWPLLVLRGMCGALAMNAFYASIQRLLLAEALALLFLNPAIVAVLAFAVLGERLVMRQIGGIVASLVGSQMDRAKGSYSEAMRRLTDGPGNLVGRVEKLKKLGAKATKQQNEKLLRRSQESDNEE